MIEKLLSKKSFLMKIVSVLIGVVIWIILIFSEDATLERTLKGVKVDIKGTQILVSNDLAVSNGLEIPNAYVTVRGKRSDILQNMNNITAEIDVSGILSPGKYSIPVTYNLPSNTIYTTGKRLGVCEVTVSRLSSKTLDIKVIHEGVTYGNTIIESVPGKKKMTVKAYSEDIDKIAAMGVIIDVSKITADNTEDYRLIPLDKNDTPLSLDYDVYSAFNSISVNNIVLSKKTLPVRVNVTGADDENTVKLESVSQEEIAVGIRKNATVSELVAELSFTPSVSEYTIPIKETEGVYIPPESSKIKVICKQYPAVEKYITVPLKVNSNSHQVHNAPDTVTLRVRGAAGDIVAANIEAAIDISALPVGTGKAPVTVKFLESGMTLCENPEISVDIK